MTVRKTKKIKQISIPKGYVLVPVEPTERMCLAFEIYSSQNYNPANKKEFYKAKHTWAAMLRAAEEN
jgi:hypothetical protein